MSFPVLPEVERERDALVDSSTCGWEVPVRLVHEAWVFLYIIYTGSRYQLGEGLAAVLRRQCRRREGVGEEGGSGEKCTFDAALLGAAASRRKVGCRRLAAVGEEPGPSASPMGQLTCVRPVATRPGSS